MFQLAAGSRKPLMMLIACTSVWNKDVLLFKAVQPD